MTDITIACERGDHDCHGYVAPLVYSASMPCGCECHETTNPRDFGEATRRAEASFYNDHGERTRRTVTLNIDGEYRTLDADKFHGRPGD